MTDRLPRQKCAVKYLRSSKDRHAVSIESQGREIDELIRRDGFVCVATYEDQVESGKSDRRPAFQEMIALARSKERTFSRIYCYDTARFSRNIDHARLYKRDLSKAGVEVRFLKLPHDDTSTGKLVENIFESFDEFHSAKSKEDGLRGMKQKVLNGWRAGGRALYGYRLKHYQSGMVGNVPTMNSKLVPHPDEFLRIKEYLKGRLRGEARKTLAERLGIGLGVHRLLYIERSALVYAGVTVWNRHNERKDGKYIGDECFRPDNEWVQVENTHEAAITVDEAKRLIATCEARKHNRPLTRNKGYILSSLMRCRCGGSMVGNAGYYRCRDKCGAPNIRQERAEAGVLKALFDDILTEGVYRKLLKHAERKHGGKGSSAKRVAELKRQQSAIEKKQDRLSELLSETEHTRPLLKKIEDLEVERGRVVAELAKATEAREAASTGIGKNLDKFVGALRANLMEGDPEKKKALVRSALHKVVFEDNRLDIYPVIAGMREGDDLWHSLRPQGHSSLSRESVLVAHVHHGKSGVVPRGTNLTRRGRIDRTAFGGFGWWPSSGWAGGHGPFVLNVTMSRSFSSSSAKIFSTSFFRFIACDPGTCTSNSTRTPNPVPV